MAKGIGQTVRGTVSGGDALPISPAEVAQRPLFQMVAKTEHGDALLILGNVDGNREVWYGPRQTALVLEYGRVVQTINLDANLDGSRMVGANPFQLGLNHIAGSDDFDSEDDWSPGYRYAVPVHSRMVAVGPEDVTILDKPHRLLRIDEERRSSAGRWSARNQYWVDPVTGFIWKSVQQVAPGVTIELTQLKPRLQGGP